MDLCGILIDVIFVPSEEKMKSLAKALGEDGISREREKMTEFSLWQKTEDSEEALSMMPSLALSDIIPEV